MALLNIFREPRREITESVVGIATFIVAIVFDYQFATWFYDATGGKNGGCPWQLGMIFGIIFFLLLVVVAFLTHAAGEGICDALARRGIELRPKRRPENGNDNS